MIQNRRTQGRRTTGTTDIVGYDRIRDLPRLLRLWPGEVQVLGSSDQAWLVERLGWALRAERQLGLARHWSYDLTRHAAIVRAWRAEKAALDAMPCAKKAAGLRPARRQLALKSLAQA